MMQQRRRTLINDGLLFRRNQPLPDQPFLPTPDTDIYSDGCLDLTKRTSRPVSWHPSSSQYPQPQVFVPQSTQYPFPSYNDADLFTNMHQFPPTPAAYSGYTSPSIAFSPLSLPYSGYEAPQYFSTGDWSVSAAPESTTHVECQSTAALAPLPMTQSLETAQECPGDWNKFVTHGFNQVTAPPTPEDFIPLNQPEPTLASDESIPYQPLEDEEADGEVLIGMGLYDTPEKTILNMNQNGSSLFGSSFDYPEPTGKGLKLEAAWEPPAMDDDEDDQDGEEDANGEDQEDDES